MAAMTTSTRSVEPSNDPAPLPEADAREAINRWSQGFFRVRYLGDKIFLNKIVPCYSYNVRLQTQYEERIVATDSVQYHGQPLDSDGTPPDPWSMITTGTGRRPSYRCGTWTRYSRRSSPTGSQKR